jgi:hypothetical protein
MNRTTIATRARAKTAGWLAATAIASVSLTTGSARAQQDPGSGAAPVQVQAQPAASGPYQQPYAPPPLREDAPHIITNWREGEPIPPGYHPVQRMRKGPIVAGAVTLGCLYLLTALIASVWTDAANASHTSNPVAGLFVPAVGPFITIAQSSSATADFFLVLDGAGQTTGAILLIWGLTSPQTLLMRDGYGQPRIVPHPMLLGKSGAGFGLSGTF